MESDEHSVNLDTSLQLVTLEGGKISASRVESSEDHFDNPSVAEQLEGGGIDVWLVILAIDPSPPNLKLGSDHSIWLILGPLTAAADLFQRIGLFSWYKKPNMSETGAWETRDVVIH